MKFNINKTMGFAILVSFTGSIVASAEEAPDSATGEQENSEAQTDETVVVTGTRTEMPLGDSPVAAEVITRSEIESSGAEDLAGLLEEHPGVDLVRSYLGTGIRLQGLEPEHVLILVNGKRVLGAKGGVIDLSRYSVESIERVEIVKGPSSALYGSDAMGGVINIITRKSQGPLALQFHARAGAFSTCEREGRLVPCVGEGHRPLLDMSANAGVKLGPLSSQFTAGLHQSDGYDLDPSDVATNGSALEQIDLVNQTGLWLSPNLQTDTRLSYMRRQLDGVEIAASGAVFDRTNLIEDAQMAISPTWLPTTDTVLRSDAALSIYRDQYLSDQRNSNALDRYEETVERLAQANLQLDHFLAGHQFTVGVDSLAQRMASDRLEDGEGERYRIAVYAQDNAEPLSGDRRLVLVTGLRVDMDTAFGVHPTPKWAIRFDPTESVAIRSSYGWGYRAPDFKELLLLFENPGVGYVVQGNPELRPETSQSVQLGVEVKATEKVWWSINGFYNDVVDLISIGTLSEATPGEVLRFGYVNIDAAMTRGFETALNLGASKSTEFHVGYTLTDSLNRSLDRPLEGRAMHRATFKLSSHLPSHGFRGLVRCGVVGKRPFYVDPDADGVEDTEYSDVYVSLDARIAQRFSKKLELFAGVDNLLNEGDPRYVQVPPRFFYLGLNGRWSPSLSNSTAKTASAKSADLSTGSDFFSSPRMQP